MSEQFIYESHRFEKIYKAIPWSVCVYCGLLTLKNPFSVFCQKHGCNYYLHPSYQNERNKTGINYKVK